MSRLKSFKKLFSFVSVLLVFTFFSCRTYETVNKAKEVFTKTLPNYEQVVFDFSDLKVNFYPHSYDELFSNSDITKTFMRGIEQRASYFQIKPFFSKSNKNDAFIINVSLVNIKISGINPIGTRNYSLSTEVEFKCSKTGNKELKTFKISLNNKHTKDNVNEYHKDAIYELLYGVSERIVMWTNEQVYYCIK